MPTARPFMLRATWLPTILLRRLLGLWLPLLLLCVGLLPLSVQAAEPLDQVQYVADDGPLLLYRRSYAIVVGIDRYQSLPVLGGAVRDAKAMTAYLQKQGFEVTTVLDGEATRARLARLIGDELPAKLQADDRVLIYFAGHGVSRGQGDTAMGYLMPVEGDRSAPAATAISMAEVSRWFGQYAAKHVMLVADACYSGLAIGSRSVGIPPETRDYVREVTKRPVRVVLVAGSSGEEANEFGGHGLFTGQLLQAVTGAADSNRDGLVSSDELAAFVKPQVAQIARRELGASQHPQLGRMGEGEFLFVVEGAVPRPAKDKPSADAAAPAPAAPAPQTRAADRGPGAEARPDAAAPAAKKPRIAVLYFDYGGKNDELVGLQKGIAQMLVTSLQETRAFDVLEREALQAVLAELKLQKTKAIDPATAVKVGKLLGVRYLVLGGYVDLLGQLRIDTRVVEVETGKIVGTAAVNGRIDDFFALFDALAHKLAVGMGSLPAESPKPGKSPPKDAWFDLGRALDAWDRGDVPAATAVTDDLLRRYPDFLPAVRLKRRLAAP